MTVTVEQIHAAEETLRKARETHEYYRRVRDALLASAARVAVKVDDSRQQLHEARFELTELTDQRHRELFEEQQRLVAPDEGRSA